MSLKTPIPKFLKGTDLKHWPKLASAVIDSRWSMHVKYLKDLSDKSIPNQYREGLLEEVLEWKEEAQQLLDLKLLFPHQINKAKMLSKLDLTSAMAYINAKGTLIK